MFLKYNKRNLSKLSDKAFRNMITTSALFTSFNKTDFTVEDVLDHIREEDRGDWYFCKCQYCRKLTSSISVTGEEDVMSFCIWCGEGDAFFKIGRSIEKVQIIIGILKEGVPRGETILKEQVIVLLATGFEIFMKDVYATLLNIRYVRDHVSLYDRFSSESRNDFVNFGKAIEKFRKDLGIDLKKELTNSERKSMNLLLCKRHVIVHNNGFIDSTFIKQTGLDLTKGDYVPLGLDEISKFIGIMKKIINIVGRHYIEEDEADTFRTFEEFAKR